MTISSPLKLDTTYNPVLLYNLDGDLLDEGSAGADLSLLAGNTTYGIGHAHGTKGFFFRNTATGIKSATPAPASARVLGDITVQVVMRWSEFGPNGNIFVCQGAIGSLEAEHVAWDLQLSGDAGKMKPLFVWQHTSGTAVVVGPDDYTLTAQRWYHIVCRRTSDGPGTSTAEIFVNGKRVVISSGLIDATGASNSYVHLGTRNEGDTGILKCTISSAKMVDRALTDGELALEFERVAEVIR